MIFRKQPMAQPETGYIYEVVVLDARGCDLHAVCSTVDLEPAITTAQDEPLSPGERIIVRSCDPSGVQTWQGVRRFFYWRHERGVTAPAEGTMIPCWPASPPPPDPRLIKDGQRWGS